MLEVRDTHPRSLAFTTTTRAGLRQVRQQLMSYDGCCVSAQAARAAPRWWMTKSPRARRGHRGPCFTRRHAGKPKGVVHTYHALIEPLAGVLADENLTPVGSCLRTLPMAWIARTSSRMPQRS